LGVVGIGFGKLYRGCSRIIPYFSVLHSQYQWWGGEGKFDPMVMVMVVVVERGDAT
jgi:hypothetical protein